MEDRYRIPIDMDGQPPHVAVHIHASIRVFIPARKVKEARSTLSSMIDRIKVKEGCLGCRL